MKCPNCGYESPKKKMGRPKKRFEMHGGCLIETCGICYAHVLQKVSTKELFDAPGKLHEHQITLIQKQLAEQPHKRE